MASCIEPIVGTFGVDALLAVTSRGSPILDNRVYKVAKEAFEKVPLILNVLMNPESPMCDIDREALLEKMNKLRIQLQIRAGTPGQVTFLDSASIEYSQPVFRSELQECILKVLHEAIKPDRIKAVAFENKHITLLHSSQTQNGGANQITPENEVSLIQTYKCLTGKRFSPPEDWVCKDISQIMLFGSQPTKSKPTFLMVVLQFFDLKAGDPFLENVKKVRAHYAEIGFPPPTDIIDVYGNIQKLNEKLSGHDTLFQIPGVTLSELESLKKTVEKANKIFQEFKNKKGPEELCLSAEMFKSGEVTFIAVEGKKNAYSLLRESEYVQLLAKHIQEKSSVHFQEAHSQIDMKKVG